MHIFLWIRRPHKIHKNLSLKNHQPQCFLETNTSSDLVVKFVGGLNYQ